MVDIENGELFRSGPSKDGLDGCSESNSITSFRPISSLLEHSFSSCAIHPFGYSAYAITTDGRVYVWGKRLLGSLDSSMEYSPPSVRNKSLCVFRDLTFIRIIISPFLFIRPSFVSSVISDLTIFLDILQVEKRKNVSIYQ